MTKTNAGSYAFGKFHENSEELTRLKSQAGAAQALEQQILNGCGLQPGMKVLDLACGPGIVSCLLARLVGDGHVTGVDLSDDLLSEARATAAQQGLNNLQFSQGDVYKLDLPDNSFDFIYARFLFQHLEHPGRALAEARRVLKPGGLIAIADVDDNWLTLYPEPASFRSFTERAAQVQAKRGGDRTVGRKLGAKLVESDFASVQVGVYTVGSAELGMKGLLDLTTGFKYQQLAAEDKELAVKEKSEIYSLLDHPNAWGFVGIFVATGQKP